MFFIFFIVKRTLLEKRNHNYRKGICKKQRLRLLILWKTEKGFFILVIVLLSLHTDCVFILCYLILSEKISFSVPYV